MTTISQPAVQRTELDAGAATMRALPFMLLGLFLGLSNFFIVSIALPSIGRSLHAQASLLQLVVAAFSTS